MITRASSLEPEKRDRKILRDLDYEYEPQVVRSKFVSSKACEVIKKRDRNERCSAPKESEALKKRRISQELSNSPQTLKIRRIPAVEKTIKSKTRESVRGQIKDKAFSAFKKFGEPSDRRTRGVVLKIDRSHRPVVVSSSKVLDAFPVKGFFESNSGDWGYSSALHFANNKVLNKFKRQWDVLSKEKIVSQKEEDPELYDEWKAFLREQNRRGIDAVPEYLAIGPALDPKMGLGLFASDEIPRGGKIGEYVGSVTPANKKNPYVFELSEESGMSEDWHYDGLKVRNHTAFMNHSDNPNVAGFEFYDERGPHIVFYANRPIRKGEELKLNYGKGYDWEGICP